MDKQQLHDKGVNENYIFLLVRNLSFFFHFSFCVYSITGTNFFILLNKLKLIKSFVAAQGI